LAPQKNVGTIVSPRGERETLRAKWHGALRI
jgi:hypothetical protein